MNYLLDPPERETALQKNDSTRFPSRYVLALRLQAAQSRSYSDPLSPKRGIIFILGALE